MLLGLYMTSLKFNDGVEIDTSGPYRVLQLEDGFYVVGNGICWPMEDLASAQTLARRLQAGGL